MTTSKTVAAAREDVAALPKAKESATAIEDKVTRSVAAIDPASDTTDTAETSASPDAA